MRRKPGGKERRVRGARGLAAAVVIAGIAAGAGGEVGHTAAARSGDGLGVRAKRACLRAAGIETTVKRRKPDDDDAPDVRLVAFAKVTAFIALYKDIDRARRYEPEIRADAEAFDGVVERRGNVTIVWAARPGAKVRRTVRRCVFKRRG